MHNKRYIFRKEWGDMAEKKDTSPLDDVIKKIEELYEKYNAIVNGSNPNIMLQMEEFNGKGASVNSPEKMPVTVYVPIRGDIRQLYELVHECTHTFDIDNGDTSTRKVLGEVAPQCMERLFVDQQIKNYYNYQNKMYRKKQAKSF